MSYTRERMLGLTTRPSAYLRLTQLAFRGIHNRVVADVAAADLAGGSRILANFLQMAGFALTAAASTG